MGEIHKSISKIYLLMTLMRSFWLIIWYWFRDIDIQAHFNSLIHELYIDYFAFLIVYIMCFSLRAVYGTDDQRNALHGSDSFSSSEKEIRFFFPDSKYMTLSTNVHILIEYERWNHLTSLLSTCKFKFYPTIIHVWTKTHIDVALLMQKNASCL